MLKGCGTLICISLMLLSATGQTMGAVKSELFPNPALGAYNVIISAINTGMTDDMPEGFPAVTSINTIETKKYPKYKAVTYMYEGEKLESAHRFAFKPLLCHFKRHNLEMMAPVETQYLNVVDDFEVVDMSDEDIQSDDVLDDMVYREKVPDSKEGIEELKLLKQKQLAKVAFLYPNATVDLPLHGSLKKLAAKVETEVFEPRMVVSIGLRGKYTWASYAKGLRRLEKWLDMHKDQFERTEDGVPRRLFYNSPMTPSSFKISEIQIPIRQIERPDPPKTWQSFKAI
eukprot:Nk52_evm1s2614 gene=Nk52_evmTU1s2614